MARNEKSDAVQCSAVAREKVQTIRVSLLFNPPFQLANAAKCHFIIKLDTVGVGVGVCCCCRCSCFLILFAIDEIFNFPQPKRPKWWRRRNEDGGIMIER